MLRQPTDRNPAERPSVERTPIERSSLDRNALDKALPKDVEQVGILIKQFVKQASAPEPLQALTAKDLVMEEKETICAEVVFLMEKTDSETAIQPLKQWLGIDENTTEEDLFNGKVTKTLQATPDIALKIQLYHFDYYPMRKLSEEKRILKIVVYHPTYLSDYKNLPIAQEMLAKDTGICILVNAQTVDEADNAVENQWQIPGVYSRHIAAADLATALPELLKSEEGKQKLTHAKIKNHIHYLNKVYQLIALDVKEKICQMQGKAMLAYKKQWQNQSKDTELSARDSANLKWIVNTRLKQITKAVEDAVEDFEKNDSNYSKLGEEVLSFFGFVEKKSGKNLNFHISEGALQDKVKKANAVLSNFFDNIQALVNDHAKEVQQDVKNQLTTWKLPLEDKLLPERPVGVVTKEFLLDNSVHSGKVYERQIPFKGIGGLLTELRSPLMMLMPFMMIFALFGALVKGESKGTIDENALFHNNRPSIAVTQLPDSWENEYRKFINEVEEQRGKNNFFHKEISDELIAEPQLAIKEIEVSQSFGNKTKTEETLDYFFDDKNQTIYLYLNENADRNFVIQKLFDPSAKLLTISAASTRTSFGMSGIIRTLSRLTQYRYMIMIGLAALITWFIITRRRSMNKELKESKEKEQRKLNEDFKQNLDKSLKQQMQRWKTKLIDQLSDRYITLQQNVESYVNRTIETRKEQKAEELKIVQRRILAVKNDKSLLVSLKSEQRKIHTKLDELRIKAARLP